MQLEKLEEEGYNDIPLFEDIDITDTDYEGMSLVGISRVWAKE